MAEVRLLLKLLEERCSSGAWEEALSLVRRLEPLVARADRGTDEFLLYHKGYALLELNRPERAKPSLRRLVKIDPHSAHYRLLLADAFIRTQEWEAACAHLEAGLAAEPDHPGCLCALGWAFYQIGRTRDGRATLEHALELHPRYVPAHLDLGLIAAAEGRWEASEAYLEAARAIAPEDSEIRDILQAVRQSRELAEEDEGGSAEGDASGSREEALLGRVCATLRREGASDLDLLLARRFWEEFAAGCAHRPVLDAGWAAALLCASLELRSQDYCRSEVAREWGISTATLARRVQKLRSEVSVCGGNEPADRAGPPAGELTASSDRVIAVDFVRRTRLTA